MVDKKKVVNIAEELVQSRKAWNLLRTLPSGWNITPSIIDGTGDKIWVIQHDNFLTEIVGYTPYETVTRAIRLLTEKGMM